MTKRVRFILQPTIFFIEDEEDRKGQWEIVALDRARFQRRIIEIEKIIGWCLNPLHREKIFKGLKIT